MLLIFSRDCDESRSMRVIVSSVIALSKQILKKNLTQTILTPIEEKIIQVLYKITNTKRITLKEENALLKTILDEILLAKNTSALSVSILNENYEKWLIAKTKRKQVSDIYKV